MNNLARIIVLLVSAAAILLIVGAFWSVKYFKTKLPAVLKPVAKIEDTIFPKPVVDLPLLKPPLNSALERITKKPFGIYITPNNSPVSPERFSGYHTGVDFEILAGEKNIDVPVTAVCDGKLVLKKSATGYGGVAVESCQLNGQAITVIYGHLKLSSVGLKAGQKISAGQTIGLLGRGNSSETGGERKHLHLGIHKGADVSLLGYVPNKDQLNGWLNALAYIK